MMTTGFIIYSSDAEYPRILQKHLHCSRGFQLQRSPSRIHAPPEPQGTNGTVRASSRPFRGVRSAHAVLPALPATIARTSENRRGKSRKLRAPRVAYKIVRFSESPSDTNPNSE